MIIGAACENFLPRFRVRRREIVTVGQFLDLLWGEFTEEAVAPDRSGARHANH